MKLYLSSVGVPHPDRFRSLLPTRTPHVGVISNAWDVYPKAKAAPYIASVVDVLKSIGCQCRDIDLRKYEASTSNLQHWLQKLDALWVTGGNVFYLNWLMHQSGFAGLAKPLINSGLVYGGESAGAVVAGTTLQGADHIDNPGDAPKVIWEGLGIVDFGIVPHWGNQKYEVG